MCHVSIIIIVAHRQGCMIFPGVHIFHMFSLTEPNIPNFENLTLSCIKINVCMASQKVDVYNIRSCFFIIL